MIKTNKQVIILGNAAVGKTCLINRLVKNEIEKRYKSTLGCDFHLHELKFFDQIVYLNIWDSHGEEDQEYLQALDDSIYKRADGYFIVCSYDDSESLIDIEKWTEHINKFTGKEHDVPIFVVINKSDIKDKRFTFEDAKKICQNYDLPLFETSIYANFSLLEKLILKMTDSMLGKSQSYRKSNAISDSGRISLLRDGDKEYGSTALGSAEDNKYEKCGEVSDFIVISMKEKKIQVKKKSTCCF